MRILFIVLGGLLFADASHAQNLDYAKQYEREIAPRFQNLCKGGDRSACDWLTKRNLHGKVGNESEVVSYKAAKKGCDAGKVDDCARLGAIYSLGRVVDMDNNRALELFDKSCRAGSMIGCSGLATSYYFGKGVRRNVREAVKLFQKACDGGEPSSCFMLGDMFQRGAGVAEDSLLAAKYFKLSCLYGTKRACRR